VCQIYIIGCQILFDTVRKEVKGREREKGYKGGNEVADA
jgi:hypothetical protein